MKGIKNILSFSFLIALAAVFTFTSCNNAPEHTAIDKEAIDNTRSLAKNHKEMGYSSLATFKSGRSQLSIEQLADLEGKNVNLVVLYDSSAPWADVFNSGDFSATGDDKLNGLLETFELTIEKQFELDEYNEGLVLDPDSKLSNPVDAAREISLVDYVLMVHVKEVPVDNTMEAHTSSNN